MGFVHMVRAYLSAKPRIGVGLGSTAVRLEKYMVDSIVSGAFNIDPRVRNCAAAEQAREGDYSLLMGVSHSRLSWNPELSVYRLNHFYGRIMITAYPFQSYSDTAVFDKKGKRLS
jgi:hypothetical protein